MTTRASLENSALPGTRRRDRTVVARTNLPLPGRTTGHATGVAIAVIVVGPSGAIIAISAALFIQALFFGDGGITAFGAARARSSTSSPPGPAARRPPSPRRTTSASSKTSPITASSSKPAASSPKGRRGTSCRTRSSSTARACCTRTVIATSQASSTRIRTFTGTASMSISARCAVRRTRWAVFVCALCAMLTPAHTVV